MRWLHTPNRALFNPEYRTRRGNPPLITLHRRQRKLTTTEIDVPAIDAPPTTPGFRSAQTLVIRL